MTTSLKEKQDKAKREQKILAIGMAVLVTIVTYMLGWDNTGWQMLAVIYIVSVAGIISYELWDEARVRGWVREYNESVPIYPVFESETAQDQQGGRFADGLSYMSEEPFGTQSDTPPDFRPLTTTKAPESAEIDIIT